jgi:MFS family permease
VTAEANAQEPEWAAGGQRLAVLLAMAMFVLVVDTSLMNVSIAKVVEDLDTTVSGVQGAIALEALVSAAFILIGSKVGDLIGRKRAFVMGLLGYALGALAMAFAQDLMAIIVFWAIVGGLGASLLLPAMQSLIAVGLVGLGSLARWLVRRKREGKPTLLDPALFKHDLFRLGISSQMLQNIGSAAR